MVPCNHHFLVLVSSTLLASLVCWSRQSPDINTNDLCDPFLAYFCIEQTDNSLSFDLPFFDRFTRNQNKVQAKQSAFFQHDSTCYSRGEYLASIVSDIFQSSPTLSVCTSVAGLVLPLLNGSSPNLFNRCYFSCGAELGIPVAF